MSGLLIQNGKQAFSDANGRPLVNGKVFLYVPATSTLKDTWQDAAQVALNTNPVILDARGEASIYGVGPYRQVLMDKDENLIWDQLVTDPSGTAQTSIDGFKTDLANNTDPAKGAALVGYKNRTVAGRLSETSSLRDTAGVVGGGGGDNLTPVNSALASAVGRALFIDDDLFRVSARPTNNRGIEYTGPGAIAMATTFGLQQLNTYATRYLNGVHKEHLYKVYKRLTQGGQLKIYTYGDSTVQGGNGETAAFTTSAMIIQTLANKGISNALLVNRGVAGTTVSDMNALGDIDPSGFNTTDLFIIKYGINDTKDITSFYSNFRTKLLAIRAAINGNVHGLAILLMGPSTTYDIPNGRDAKWYEKLRGVFIALCEEFQCAYYDTYAQIQDSSTASTYWMDDPFGDKRGVHMLDVGQNWIWPQMIDWAFGFGETRSFASNNFLNSGSASGVPLAATPATSFNLGISIYRATPGQGWPADGFVKTERGVDGGAIQNLWTFASGASRTYTRIWLTGSGSWAAWSGVIIDATLLNAWVNFGSTRRNAGYYKSNDGRGYACGTIKSGTITASTPLFTVPPEYRPAFDHVCLCRGAGGGIGIGISAATGNVFLQSAGDATETCLDNLSWPIG